MKKILTCLLLLVAITSFSQTIKELESELSYYKSDEKWGNKKDVAFKLLEVDKLNENAISYLVEVYGRNNQKDSIRLLFDKLIKENPTSSIPFIQRARERNANFEGLTHEQRINYLKESLKLDSLNTEAVYTLGKLYYTLFIQEYSQNRDKATLSSYSTNSIHYFTMLCNKVNLYKAILRYPLLQLANYLGDTSSIKRYESYTDQLLYFPISAFVDLPKGWQANYSINVIEFVSKTEFKVSGVESAEFEIAWYSKQLDALEEPVLSDTLPTKIFRFTWLRTFHNPVVVCLQNSNGLVTLYWKVCSGRGGYDPGKIIEDKRKTLTNKEWSDFVNRINSINFWDISSVNSSIGNDGAQWILEGKELGRYKVVDRWGGDEIRSICNLLLKMTDLQIKESEIY